VLTGRNCADIIAREKNEQEKVAGSESPIDDKALADALGKLVEGKTQEGTALVAGVLVTALTAHFLGPGALFAGKLTEGAVKRFADRVSDSATKRMLNAGEQLDKERATTAELGKAISKSLEEVLSSRDSAVVELGLQGQEQFLQLINFTRYNVVQRLDQLITLVAQIQAGIDIGSTDPSGRHAVATKTVVSISRLPVTGKHLFGREKELAALDEAWTNSKTHIVTLVAWGGVGKSALVNHWLGRLAAGEYASARRVYGWSFYSQGTTDRVVSATLFIESALRWFGDSNPNTGSPWEKGERLAQLIKTQRTLLLLDGLEPLQFPPGQPEEGKLKDRALQALLRELAASNAGLCLITTRLPVADLADFESSTVRQIDLEHLAPQAGAQLLRVLGVRGEESELVKAAEEFGGHSLALTLLGSYLTDVCDADVRRRDVIDALENHLGRGGQARRVMASYEKWLGEGPELAVLRLLGLFDRPADNESVKALRAPPAIPGLTDNLLAVTEPEWKYVLARLRRAKLLAQVNEYDASTLDAHPLVREHFGVQLRATRPTAWSEGNFRLYEHLKVSSAQLPEKLEEMEPLYAAVAHGCQANRHQQTMDEVYLPRILRGAMHYSTLKLGAFGAEVAALSAFFAPPWQNLVDGLNEATATDVLKHTGYCLRSLVRLEEAAEVLKLAHRAHVERREWISAADDAGILNYLYLTSGNLRTALEYAQRGVEQAHNSEQRYCRLASFSRVGATLHQLGRLAEAEAAFDHAEARQLGYPELFSIAGFQDVQFCDFLLERGEYKTVETRLAPALDITAKERRLLPNALTHWLLGRAHWGQGRLEQAASHLQQAVEGVRQAARPDYLPMCLLTQAELRRNDGVLDQARANLDEASRISSRSRMGLQEADCNLAYARLYLSLGQRDRAQEYLMQARQMVKGMGYHRRDIDLKDLEAGLGFSAAVA
jgi:tetratricopeptide (TPR) repeat protein